MSHTDAQPANLMASLSLRDIPDDLYARLKDRAVMHRRSLNAEVLTILDGALRSHRLTANAIEERIAQERRGLEASLLSDDVLAEARRSGRP